MCDESRACGVFAHFHKKRNCIFDKKRKSFIVFLTTQGYNNSNKALLIKGARQVGKTHVIRETLDAMGCNYVEINLIAIPEAVKILQEFNSINELIMGLSTLTEKPFIKGQTVIFI